MGFGIGISIGWPNASAQAIPAVMGYFKFNYDCNGTYYDLGTSTLMDISTYAIGDYVLGTNSTGYSVRVILNNITLSGEGDAVFELSGPAYNSCGI